MRPGTPAAKLPDDVSAETKAVRNQELLKVQKKITNEKSRANLGKVHTIFVEGRNPENPKEWVGRMDQDRRVLFESGEDCSGKFVRLEFVELYHETFRAKLI